MSISDLCLIAQAYARHTGLQISTVSSYAANDGKWLGKLIAGEVGCTVGRLDRLMVWFSTNWPADLDWPRDIPRPSKTKEAA